MTIEWDLDTESTSLVTTELDSLADDTESSLFTLDNSGASDKWLYGKIRIELGSITPGTGANIILRVYGPNADKGSSPFSLHVLTVASGTAAKTVEAIVQLPPYALELSIENRCGVTLASSANDVYWQGISEKDA